MSQVDVGAVVVSLLDKVDEPDCVIRTGDRSAVLRLNGDVEADLEAQKAYLPSMEPVLGGPRAIDGVDAAELDIMFVVGGHGPMQDLAVDPDIGTIMAGLSFALAEALSMRSVHRHVSRATIKRRHHPTRGGAPRLDGQCAARDRGRSSLEPAA